MGGKFQIFLQLHLKILDVGPLYNDIPSQNGSSSVFYPQIQMDDLIMC